MPRIAALLTAFALIAPGASSAPAQEQRARFSIFVTSDGAVEGFTDPDLDKGDSVKDLQKAISALHVEPTPRTRLNRAKPGRFSPLLLVESQTGARLVVVVTGRERAQVTATFFGAGRECILRASLRVDGRAFEIVVTAPGGTLSSNAGGGWTKAAQNMAARLEEWVEANGTLLSKR